MPRPLIRILLAAVAVAAMPVAPAAAKLGRCLGGRGPVCHFWTGKVIRVDDGDTLHVNIKGDGRGARKVRVADIQAMEQSVYSTHPQRRRGECHALEATARLERLVKAGHRRV